MSVVNTAYGFAFFVIARISARYHHYGYGCSGVYDHGLVAELAESGIVHEFEKVAFYTEHNCFGLGVAHAYIVFDYFRLALDIYEPEKYEAAVFDALFSKTFDRRLDDTCAYFLHESVIGKRYRAHCSHASGVQSGIAFADAFIVFGYG